MEDKHRTILRLYWSNIRENLEPKEILSKLVTVLNETDEEEIRAQSTRQERCDKLLEILPRRGKNAFNVFVNALDTEAQHLALDLTEAEKGTENELIRAREQSAKHRGEIRKLKTELEAEKQDHIKTSQELKELKSLHETSETESSEQIQKLAEIIQELKDESCSRCEGLEDERDSARRENQTLENEIQELKKKSEDYQRKNQALLKNLESVKEKHRNLELLSENLEAADKEQQEKMRQLQTKNEELEFKVTNSKSELKELLAESIQQLRDESCSRCEALKDERDSTIREIQTLGVQIQELKIGITKLTKDYQLNIQTPQRTHQSLEENHGNLSQALKAAKEKHQKEMKGLQRENKKLLEDLDKSKEVRFELEKELEKSQRDLKEVEKNLACENQRVEEYQQKFQALSKATDDLPDKKLENAEQLMRKECETLQATLREERSRSDNLRKEVHRLRLKEMPGRIYMHGKDFDDRGVVYALTTNSGKTSKILATRSSNGEGKAEDLLKNQVKRGTVSGTKDMEDSWWCVDLTDKYALYLTHYTLRHGRDRSGSVLLNWRLEGSLDGRKWVILRIHKDERGLREHRPYCTCTWALDGNSNAFRYFRIFHTGKNSSGNFSIFLSGIELYGVLIEKSS